MWIILSSKYRLSSSAFERKDKSNSQNKAKVYFISVEGNNTEVKYFEGIRKYMEKLYIPAIIDIEVLKRKKSDTNSAPAYVIDIAISRAKKYETDLEKLIDRVGTNIGKLIEEMRKTE